MNITAQNTFTTAIIKSVGQPVAFSVSGTFVATVTVQRSRDGATWLDVDSTTAPTELDATSAGGWHWRAGVKTGQYTSGTAIVNVY